MPRPILILTTLFLVASCGGTPQPALTANDVIAKFKAAGIQVDNVKPRARDPQSPLPNSFQEDLTFTVPSLGDKGGQVFVCASARNCDALYAYFDALKALAGPYLYRNQSGTVVVQLNNGLRPDEAQKFEQVVKSL